MNKLGLKDGDTLDIVNDDEVVEKNIKEENNENIIIIKEE